MKIKLQKPDKWGWLQIGGMALGLVGTVLKSIVSDHKLTEKIKEVVREELKGD